MIVVDANVALLWTIDDPHSRIALKLLRFESHLIAPYLIIPELTNAFHRYGNQFPDRWDRLRDGMEFLPRWFSELAPSPLLRMRAFELAQKLQHSAYDCYYLALALARDVKIVTADAHFVREIDKSVYAGQGLYLADWQP